MELINDDLSIDAVFADAVAVGTPHVHRDDLYRLGIGQRRKVGVHCATMPFLEHLDDRFLRNVGNHQVIATRCMNLVNAKCRRSLHLWTALYLRQVVVADVTICLLIYADVACEFIKRVGQ